MLKLYHRLTGKRTKPIAVADAAFDELADDVDTVLSEREPIPGPPGLEA